MRCVYPNRGPCELRREGRRTSDPSWHPAPSAISSSPKRTSAQNKEGCLNYESGAVVLGWAKGYSPRAAGKVRAPSIPLVVTDVALLLQAEATKKKGGGARPGRLALSLPEESPSCHPSTKPARPAPLQQSIRTRADRTSAPLAPAAASGRAWRALGRGPDLAVNTSPVACGR